MVSVQLVPIVGQADEQTWSQVLTLPHEERQVVVAVTLKGEEVEEKGSEWLNRLRGDDGAIFEEMPFNVSWLKARVESRPEITSLLVVGFGHHEVMVLGYGNAEMVMKRGDKVGVILKAPEQEWLLRKGSWQPGDRFLMGTKGLMGK